MAEEKRRILRVDFDFDRMLSMGAEAGRQYFLTEFFPPLAYNAWETRPARYALLHICRSLYSGLYFPLLSLVNVGGNGAYMPAIPPSVFSTEEEWNWNNFGMYERTFGVAPNRDKISAALERCFAECFRRPKPVSIGECPLVATIQDCTGPGGESYKLSVMVKTKSQAPHEGILSSQVLSRDDAMKLSGSYGLYYNALTGEWEGMCSAVDGPCSRCDALKKSKAARSFYDDGGAV